MGDGVGGFLVVLFFIIVSMMDGAARKRRRAAQQLEHLPASDDFPDEEEDLGRFLESSEGRFIEPDGGGAIEFDREMTIEPDEAIEQEPSEGIGPADLWEGIAALARGESPAQRLQDYAARARGSTAAPADTAAGVLGSEEAYSPPGESLPVETRPPDLQAGYAHPDQAETHQEHAQVVTPARPLSEGRPHEFALRPTVSPTQQEKKPARAQQAQSLLEAVTRGDKRSLRDAIILSEVLSPPIALRGAPGPPYER